MSGVTPQQTAARLIREREAQQRAERIVTLASEKDAIERMINGQLGSSRDRHEPLRGVLRAPAATGSLSTIEKLLALQIRLLAIGFGFERDGEVLADVKQDLAAVRRGDFDEVRPQRGLKALNLADDELGDVVADRVPDPAVDHRDNLSRHSRLPRLHGRLTRYVAVGAILVALRQLQRRAWTRRASASAPGPSGATNGGVW